MLTQQPRGRYHGVALQADHLRVMPVVGPVRFDEREVETKLWNGYTGTGTGNRQANLCRHRATSRLHRRPTKYLLRSANYGALKLVVLTA